MADSKKTMPKSILLAAIVLLTSCSRTRVANATSEPPAATVPVFRVAKVDLSRTLMLTGEFRPFQEVDVLSKVAGYVKKINVDVGDRVTEGQVLATLEIPEMANDLSRADAALARSHSEVERAKDELRRAQSTHEITHLAFSRLQTVSKTRPGLVAQQEVDEARTKDLVSEAQISAAESTLQSAGDAVHMSDAEKARVGTMNAYARVTAPFAGVITKRFADTGSMIQAGTASQTQAMPIVRLSQNGLLRLIVPAPESIVPQIRIGSSMEVEVPTLHRTFYGKVARFTDRVQTSTRTMDTEIDVPNRELILIPGMYANVKLGLEQRHDALSIPLLAVSRNGDKPSVWLVTAGNRVAERQVKLGLETADGVEVLNGLQEGDLVIIGRPANLQVGQTVKPKAVQMGSTEGAS